MAFYKTWHYNKAFGYDPLEITGIFLTKQALTGHFGSQNVKLGLALRSSTDQLFTTLNKMKK